MNDIKKLLREGLGLNEIIVFHGTNEKFVNDIKTNGLTADNYHSPEWFTVATDFGSALFHATPSDDKKTFLYVFEFKVPVDNSKWEGYPYFWKPYDRKNNSKWFALKQPLESKFIAKVHEVKYDDYINQKNKGY